MRHLILPILLLLAGCAPTSTGDVAARAQLNLPPMKSFVQSYPRAPRQSNKDIARDFLDLTFELESGRALKTFTRFDQPITIRVTGNPPPTLSSDLDRLVGRLRREAGIDITRTQSETANITIEAVSRRQIQRQLPKAACFVVPNITKLSDYRATRNSRATNWGLLEKREQIAIFLPNDASPQEVRDCLHEELAQAIGPLNDLYRLSDSVFNDDNVHTVLTGFDMLILRTYYAAELKTGMTRKQVAARLPAILARLNPAGTRRKPRPTPKTPRVWIDAVQTALGPGSRAIQRLKAAQKALRIASDKGWTDHRLAFSHYAIGRLTQSIDPDFALKQFEVADVLYRRSPNLAIHRAYSASQLAAHMISLDQHEKGVGNYWPQYFRC